MLKAVLFDFDQTLVNSADGFRRAEKWLQQQLFAALGLGDWDAFIAVYRAVRGGAGAGESPAAKLAQWRQVCAQFGGAVPEGALLSWQDGYWDRVEAGTAALPDAAAVLADLGRRFRLGLVSNASAVGERSLRSRRFPGLTAAFDAIVVCDGAAIPLKPDPAGFRRVLGQLGADAGEAIHVGDSWETDITGARAAGVQPVWLRHRAIERRAPAAVPDDVVLIDTLEPLAQLQPGDEPEAIAGRLRPAPRPLQTLNEGRP